jgi:hypothetical protein
MPDPWSASTSSVPYRRERLQVGPLAAGLAVFGFMALGMFQLALALGAPLGHAAWGGDSADLTSSQRVGSAVSVVVYAAAAAVVLARVGLTTRPRRRWLLSWGPWFLAALFALSGFANLASQSRWETYLLGPSAVVLAALCVVIGRTPLRSG